ncbi:MAG: hypothetical protein RBJ76_28845 [Stenomitos frigidus ULC029]
MTDTLVLSSNKRWIVDHFVLDVLIVDESRQIVGRPNLTIVIDEFSRCIAGFHLSLKRREGSHLISALRNAILQKNHSHEYGTQNSWVVYGVPHELIIDNGMDSRSKVLTDFVKKLSINLLFLPPGQPSKLEKVLRQVDNECLSLLPVSALQSNLNAGADISQRNCLSLQELEKLLTCYVCDCYNQQPDSQGSATRSQKWLSSFGEKLPKVIANC